MNDNSKIVVVEGNIHAGKQDFAKRLAKELGMKYMPPVELEPYFINPYGFDYRGLNPLLPERLRFCDWEMFHECPNRHSVIMMQLYLFKLRLFQYIRAVAHLLNTGQGVVMCRSVFSEQVMVDAMHQVGWLPKGYMRNDGMQFYDWRAYYLNIRNLSLSRIPKPHLAIYLETPVDVCLDRIKQSNDPMIANSKAHTPEFLEAIESCYVPVMQKLDYNGHTITFEYNERATDDEILDVVDDIEELDFTHDLKDTRFMQWESDKSTAQLNMYLSNMRWKYSSYRGIRGLMSSFYIDLYFDIAGMGDSITQGDLKLREVLYQNHIGNYGFFAKRANDLKLANNKLAAIFDYKPYPEKLHSLVYSDCP